MGIRREVGLILGETIPKDGWDEVFSRADTRGSISQRQILDIVILLIKHIEKYEGDAV